MTDGELFREYYYFRKYFKFENKDFNDLSENEKRIYIKIVSIFLESGITVDKISLNGYQIDKKNY